MKIKPILFSTPMVQAILSGRKTQTRRKISEINSRVDGYTWSNHEVSFQDMDWNDVVVDGKVFANECYLKVAFPKNNTRHRVYPKLKIGDILWVRETWQHTKIININSQDENYGIVFKADGQPWEDYEGWTWKPSIFMPKVACRLFLEVTNVRVERLHDISEEDAVKEGVYDMFADDTSLAPNTAYYRYGTTKKEILADHWAHVADDAIHSFFSLWQSINGKESLEANPWVWVYDFKITEQPKNFLTNS